MSESIASHDGTGRDNPAAGEQLMVLSLSVTKNGSGLRVERLRKLYRKKMVIRDILMTLSSPRASYCWNQVGWVKTQHSTWWLIGCYLRWAPSRWTAKIVHTCRCTATLIWKSVLCCECRRMRVEDNSSAVLGATIKYTPWYKEQLEELLPSFLTAICTTHLHWLCPMENRNLSKSYTAQSPTRNISCRMNPLLTSTRWASAMSGTWQAV